MELWKSVCMSGFFEPVESFPRARLDFEDSFSIFLRRLDFASSTFSSSPPAPTPAPPFPTSTAEQMFAEYARERSSGRPKIRLNSFPNRSAETIRKQLLAEVAESRPAGLISSQESEKDDRIAVEDGVGARGP